MHAVPCILYLVLMATFFMCADQEGKIRQMNAGLELLEIDNDITARYKYNDIIYVTESLDVWLYTLNYSSPMTIEYGNFATKIYWNDFSVDRSGVILFQWIEIKIGIWNEDVCTSTSPEDKIWKVAPRRPETTIIYEWIIKEIIETTLKHKTNEWIQSCGCNIEGNITVSFEFGYVSAKGTSSIKFWFRNMMFY